MKTWRKKYFREIDKESWLRLMIKRGEAKTEEEAYSKLKYMWKHATREIYPDGCESISFPPIP